jgi:hypothetical protein
MQGPVARGPALSLRGGSAPLTALKMANPNSTTKDAKFALLFDCDGVIVLTEEVYLICSSSIKCICNI